LNFALSVEFDTGACGKALRLIESATNHEGVVRKGGHRLLVKVSESRSTVAIWRLFLPTVIFYSR
jgi:hypothetical protein